MKSHSVSVSAALPDIPTLFTLPIFWAKELRVILPVAIAGGFCTLLGSFIPGFFAGLIAWFVYPLICSLIVALAFGHDYIHRTITSALALPVSRKRIFWVRIGLCAAVLLPLLLLDYVLLEGPFTLWAMLFGHGNSASPWLSFFKPLLLVAMPAFAGLCLAPWLTMISRSPMFGTVISMGTPFAVSRLYGLILEATGRTDNAWIFFNPILVAVLCVIGAILSYRRFITLEVIESTPADQIATNITRSRSIQRFHKSLPIWQLVKKEVMLQRVPIAVALIMLAITSLLKGDQAALWSVAYPGMIILLFGSVASAEERQIGAAEWQTLMPVPFWKQWSIKFSMTWILALIFGVALPVLTLKYKTNEFASIAEKDLLVVIPTIAAGVFLITAVTLYVSSLCNSGVRAMMLAVLANSLVMLVGTTSVEAYSHFVEHERGWTSWLSWDAVPFAVAAAGFVGLLIHFAMKNHRYTDRGTNRILRQLIIFGAYAAFAIAAIFSFWNAVTL